MWRCESAWLLQMRQLRAGLYKKSAAIARSVDQQEHELGYWENGREASDLLRPEASSDSAEAMAEEQKLFDTQKLPVQ